MTALSSIASSGLQVAQLRLDASAHNVANMNTPGFKRQSVAQQAQPGGGVSAAVKTAPDAETGLEQDAVEQLSATYAFKASLQILKTADRMLGTLLSERA